jgi:hypothetical protein
MDLILTSARACLTSSASRVIAARLFKSKFSEPQPGRDSGVTREVR